MINKEKGELTSEPIKLVITLDRQTGQVNVNGPINDRLLCFGLIELAKEAINANAIQQKNEIMVARPFPNLLRKQ